MNKQIEQIHDLKPGLFVKVQGSKMADKPDQIVLIYKVSHAYPLLSDDTRVWDVYFYYSPDTQGDMTSVLNASVCFIGGVTVHVEENGQIIAWDHDGRFLTGLDVEEQALVTKLWPDSLLRLDAAKLVPDIEERFAVCL